MAEEQPVKAREPSMEETAEATPPSGRTQSDGANDAIISDSSSHDSIDTQEETPAPTEVPPSSPPPPAGKNDETTTMPSPAPHDRKGRCVKHPQIQLRKRSALSKTLGRVGLAGNEAGWTTLRLRCPLCTLGPAASATVAGTADSFDFEVLKRSSSCSTASCSSDDDFHASSDTLASNHDACEADHDFASHSSGSHSSGYQDEPEDVVCGMPYHYAHQAGSYTGQIDPVSRMPHGMGTWRSIALAPPSSTSDPSSPAGGTKRHGGPKALLEGEWIHGHLYYKPAHLRCGPHGMPNGNGNSLLKHGLENIVEYVAGEEDADAISEVDCCGAGHGRAESARHPEEEEGPPFDVVVDGPRTFDVVVPHRTVPREGACQRRGSGVEI